MTYSSRREAAASNIFGPLDDLGLISQDPVVSEAMRRWKRCSEWEATARERFLDDVKFAEGDPDNGFQWPAALKRNRDVDKRPCLTLNIVRQHNLQIRNESKQNKASIKIRATGGGATFKSANLIEAVVRNIEYRSNAQAAYAHAAKYQVDGGIGWFRIITQYTADDSFDQELLIKKVWDPLSIYIDPDAHEEDKSDANFAFVFDLVSKEKFFEAYPEFDGIATLQPLGVGTSDDDFVGKDYVRVCEYFRRVKIRDKLVSFLDPSDGLRKNLLESKMPKGLYKELKANKKENLLKERETSRMKVEWHLIVGQETVDETEWAGEYIPLIPMIGEESVIDGVLDRKGHTRNMKDAQRMYNYNAELSLNTEIPTPSGWTTVGELKEGMKVFDHKGKPVPIKAMLPIHSDRNCYKITFDNGYSVVTDEGHIWKVEARGNRTSAGWIWYDATRCTGELEPKRHFIRVPEALALPDNESLPIDPYVFGCWLGDGHVSSGRMSGHEDDFEEQRALFAELGYFTGEPKQDKESKGISFTVLDLRDKLAKNKTLFTKRVPMEYLRASKAQRLSLLQGLMDTDGHFAEATHQCIFVNTNKNLANAVLELCASLGIKAAVSKQPSQASIFPSGKMYISKENYRVQFTADPDMPVFRLWRKMSQQTAGRLTHWRRYKRIGIKKIEKVDSVETRCISLDTPEHLYLCTRGMIPTHNSAQVEFVALQSKTPYIASNKAIEEYEQMWNTANVVNHSVLIYNAFDPDHPDKPLNPPVRQNPPTSAPGFQEGMETSFNQMMMTSGQWQNQMGMVGNERTGSAIQARQAQADTSVFHYQDNYGAALRSAGKKIINLLPFIYDTKRLMRLSMEDGEEFDLSIDPKAQNALQELMNESGGVVARILNPSIGQYDVEADVGASYGTRRQETVQALTLVLTQAPGLTGIIGDLLLRAMDFKEAKEAAMRLRRLVPPQALGDGPSPQEQQLQQRLTASQTALAKALQEAAKKDLKLVGKDEMRDIDVYKAHTDRVAALAKLIPNDPKLLNDLLSELDADTIKETLRPILEANLKHLNEQSGGEPDGNAEAEESREAAPPMDGAKKAPDGEWYILDPTRRGKYLRIAPLAQEKAPRGVVGNG